MIWWEVPKKSSFDDEILKEISIGKSCNGFFGCGKSWQLSAHISHILQIAMNISMMCEILMSVALSLLGFLPSTRLSCRCWSIKLVPDGVNGLKFTCKFQERCQIPAISAPGSEAAQHQTTISVTKTWHVWLNQEVEGIGAWMLEWSEQFSMATWLSSHKEKQVRQDHAGHVDSADVSLPFLLICKICFLYFAFDRCEHVLQSCLTVLQSCSTVKNCGFYARSGRRWRSLLCCQRRSHIIAAKSLPEWNTAYECCVTLLFAFRLCLLLFGTKDVCMMCF